MLDALDHVDGVFALAGFLTLPLSQNPGLGLEVNVLGMYNIVEACRYRGVKKVVFASSVATYGNPEADAVDERTPFYWETAPPALALYAASKIIGENLLRLYQQRYGLNYASPSLRYATVYGERQHHRGVNAVYIIASYERIKAGQPPILPGDGSEGHDYIYVGDVARATVMAMASEVSGESFVIATGVDTSLNDIAHILLRLTGSSLQPVYQDAPGTVAATTKATLGYRPTKAKQLLGWEAQVGVEEGVRRLIAWAEDRNAPVDDHGRCADDADGDGDCMEYVDAMHHGEHGRQWFTRALGMTRGHACSSSGRARPDVGCQRWLAPLLSLSPLFRHSLQRRARGASEEARRLKSRKDKVHIKIRSAYLSEISNKTHEEFFGERTIHRRQSFHISKLFWCLGLQLLKVYYQIWYV